MVAAAGGQQTAVRGEGEAVHVIRVNGPPGHQIHCTQKMAWCVSIGSMPMALPHTRIYFEISVFGKYCYLPIFFSNVGLTFYIAVLKNFEILLGCPFIFLRKMSHIVTEVYLFKGEKRTSETDLFILFI